MGYDFMTPVQQKVLAELPTLSSDCLVQAKTGTGKTIAFLLPAIQNLLENKKPFGKGQVSILIIAPTRELAQQIQKECDQVTACMPTKLECHAFFGGNGRPAQLNRFLNGRPTIVVATPGRLNDVLGEERVRERFSNIQTLILDEADRMLDQGFAPDINKILKRLPRKSEGWQGMCFSATLPNQVQDVVKCVLFPGYTSLSTLDPNEVPTADKVPQYFTEYSNSSDQFAALYALLKAEAEEDPENFKAIVFGTTANGTALLFDLFQSLMPKYRKFELHSRMNQNARTKTTELFKNTATGILFASDVVGRGMDFPNVGHVIQFGLPSSAEQYVHRVGRTARAGKEGRAVLLVSKNESFFVHVNKSLPIQPYPSTYASNLKEFHPDVSQAFNNVDEVAKSKAYSAYLGYNKTYLKKLRLNAAGLVQMANEYARAMGCPEPPMLDKKLVGKMGLKGVPGLRIGNKEW
ncbi:DEAD-domain-containing protein [Delitschia confertaspora ATCC 74209]|uniref:ATP-dependent RNA helicase n=1 Tax=Delitschia confertaspora ATCC 74209 TaxID=1513339 RepID=A0A9P4MYG8_9PLEO|nr:DEAD-domain-containing protein [Delitschia confertaspora ATCC 74209]